MPIFVNPIPEGKSNSSGTGKTRLTAPVRVRSLRDLCEGAFRDGLGSNFDLILKNLSAQGSPWISMSNPTMTGLIENRTMRYENDEIGSDGKPHPTDVFRVPAYQAAKPRDTILDLFRACSGYQSRGGVTLYQAGKDMDVPVPCAIGELSHEQYATFVGSGSYVVNYGGSITSTLNPALQRLSLSFFWSDVELFFSLDDGVNSYIIACHPSLFRDLHERHQTQLTFPEGCWIKPDDRIVVIDQVAVLAPFQFGSRQDAFCGAVIEGFSEPILSGQYIESLAGVKALNGARLEADQESLSQSSVQEYVLNILFPGSQPDSKEVLTFLSKVGEMSGGAFEVMPTMFKSEQYKESLKLEEYILAAALLRYGSTCFDSMRGWDIYTPTSDKAMDLFNYILALNQVIQSQTCDRFALSKFEKGSAYSYIAADTGKVATEQFNPGFFAGVINGSRFMETSTRYFNQVSKDSALLRGGISSAWYNMCDYTTGSAVLFIHVSRGDDDPVDSKMLSGIEGGEMFYKFNPDGVIDYPICYTHRSTFRSQAHLLIGSTKDFVVLIEMPNDLRARNAFVFERSKETGYLSFVVSIPAELLLVSTDAYDSELAANTKVQRAEGLIAQDDLKGLLDAVNAESTDNKKEVQPNEQSAR